MKIIIPTAITSEKVNSNNVPASTKTAWSSSGTYASGSEVVALNVDGVPHEYIWLPPTEDSISATSAYPPSTKSVVKRSDMKPSATSVDEKYRAYWLDNGPTNEMAMFSQRSRRATTNPEEIRVSITPGELFNAVALINVEADSAVVTMTDPEEGVVHSEEVDMLDLSNVYDLYTWCFAPIKKKSEFVLTGFPAYPEAKLDVLLSNPGEDAKMGELVAGFAVEIGALLYGASIGSTDYSDNKTDENGVTTIQTGTYSKVISYPVRINTVDHDYIEKITAGIRATPCVFIGADHLPGTISYGICTDFSEVISGFVKSDCNIQVKETSL